MSILISGLVMVGMLGGVFLTPLYLQNVQGLSAIDTGLLLMPQSIAMAAMMPISGRLFDKFGVVPLGVVGLTLMGITTFELHKLTILTSHAWLDTMLTIRGLGIGLCMMPLTTVGMNALPNEHVGRASSLSNVIRQVMGSFGIAVLTAIMSQRTVFHTAIISENVSITSDTAIQLVTGMSGSYAQYGVDAGSAAGGAFSLLGGLVQLEGYVRGIGDTFLISALPILFCIPLVFLLRKKKAKEISVSKP